MTFECYINLNTLNHVPFFVLKFCSYKILLNKQFILQNKSKSCMTFIVLFTNYISLFKQILCIYFINFLFVNMNRDIVFSVSGIRQITTWTSLSQLKNLLETIPHFQYEKLFHKANS
ncbi:hypothetical protein BpHYR1_044922 [Brachionus plicatilis]|uniref:Transmembrane protein n=1 Tax=Brachionus plicatilis TaxID=10195 RepID=A0A3M7R6Y7_BRAPC|nr:hypothetical protein BpHYR1_044922 [Brachionus plicatilis]